MAIPETLSIYVAGRWCPGAGAEYTTEYPADGSTVARLNAANGDDVEEAVQAAEAARQRASWAGLKAHRRAGGGQAPGAFIPAARRRTDRRRGVA